MICFIVHDWYQHIKMLCYTYMVHNYNKIRSNITSLWMFAPITLSYYLCYNTSIGHTVTFTEVYMFLVVHSFREVISHIVILFFLPPPPSPLHFPTYNLEHKWRCTVQLVKHWVRVHVCPIMSTYWLNWFWKYCWISLQCFHHWLSASLKTLAFPWMV